jgi:SAM-dependent MidA family methyltransferase
VIPLPLAPLSGDELAHEARVIARIRDALDAAGGWLPFSRYMELALYAPGLGYYAAGAHKLGSGGDFATAPELSPVFGRCVASQVGEVLAALGGGEVVEIGAGSGALAAELLGELERQGRAPLRYRILETSPDLRERQRAALATLPAGLAARIDWLDAVPAAPLRGVLLANEVLDALPVERFRIGAAGVEALGVAFDGERFAWAARPADAALAAAVAGLGVELAAGFESELSLRLAPWLAALTAPLAAGVALFIDYGYPRAEYYRASRAGGTLGCFHRQRRHDDPFVNVGLQDLTAWVDFTRVAEAAVDCGLAVAGYTTQALFLLGNDFDRHVAAVAAGDGGAPDALAAGRAARLVLPGGMGERFKAIALARRCGLALRGFALRDFSARL